MLRVHDRRPPACLPLRLAAPDAIAVLLEQGCVRLVPVRALPAGDLEEHGPERALPLVEGREADVAVRLPLLGRVDDPIGLVEALRGARGDVTPRLLVVPEARDVGRVQVDLRLAVDHPLGDRLSDPGPFLDPDGRGRPESLHLRALPEDRHPVRRQREQPVDRVLDPGCLVADDLRHQLQCLLELRLEILLGERELGRRERGLLDRGDLVGLEEDRPVRVRADLQPGAGLPLVHVRVHVADDRVLDVALRAREARRPARCRSSGAPRA